MSRRYIHAKYARTADGLFICTKCSHKGPLGDFYVATNPRGASYRCRVCLSGYYRDRWAAKPKTATPARNRRVQRKYFDKGIPKIYFIEDPFDCVKIGFTADSVLSRLSQLQSGNSHPLQVMGWIAGTVEQEHILHQRFAHLHVRGEWFRRERELQEFILVENGLIHEISEGQAHA